MARPRWKRLTITSLKGIVAIVVLWAVGRHVVRTWNELRDQGVSLRFEASWLVWSGLLYLAGLTAYGLFYAQILRSSTAPVGVGPALRAYLISHLGKYVPGKAMVVVLRAGMVVPFGGRASTAAIATFYETLVMMSAGGLIAAAGFAPALGSRPVEFNLGPWSRGFQLPIYALAALAGAALGLVFLLLVLPPVFRRIVGLVSLPIPGVGPDASPEITSRLMHQGFSWCWVGWVLLGLSQLAVLRAFDANEVARIALALAPVVIASVALATVSGFVVAVLPGGLGVREGVLMSVLAPAVGSTKAVVAALVLRLVWVSVELAAAIILLPGFRRHRARMDSALEAGSNHS